MQAVLVGNGKGVVKAGIMSWEASRGEEGRTAAL